MFRNPLRRLLLLSALSAAAALPLVAQSTTQGAIAGTVFDASDAVVPSAMVTIRNAGTNAEVKLTSDAAGFYKAPQLLPGTYTVTVSAPGFSELRSQNVVVQVNLVTELNTHLQTGAQTQTIEVTAQAPVLNFESPAYGGHLSTGEIESIPINNRRWSALGAHNAGCHTEQRRLRPVEFSRDIAAVEQCRDRRRGR